MKRYRIILFALVAVAFAVSLALLLYSRSTSLTIKGQAIGISSETIYLERSISGTRIIVDSMELSRAGEFKFVIKDASSDPVLYELRCGWDRVPLFGCRGERIDVNSIGRFALNYIVEGSEESQLLREFYQPYVRRSDDLHRIARRYGEAQAAGKSLEDIALEYSTLYNDIKREQIAFIIGNKGNVSAIYALSQRLPGDSYLMSESSDLIYMRTVADSVAVRYPNSVYVKVLQSEVETMQRVAEVFTNVQYRNYPEIEMRDMYGEVQRLSAFDGMVILIDFWSAEMGNSNPNNAYLKELYSSMKGSGFEIYQVGIDTSRSMWINTVQQQRLPWTTVSDLRGGNSPVLGLYNITQLPSNILIDRSGDIVGRNLYGEELREAIEKIL